MIVLILFSSLVSESSVLAGSYCIPLESSNPRANPYHPKVVSLPGAQNRKGYGLPTQIEHDFTCDMHNEKPCKFEYTTSSKITVKNRKSVSFATSESYSKTSSQSNSIANINAHTKNIEQIFEQMLKKSNTSANKYLTSESLVQLFQKTNGTQSSSSTSQSTDTFEANTFTENTRASNETTVDLHVGMNTLAEISKVSSVGGSNQTKTGYEDQTSTGGKIDVRGGVEIEKKVEMPLIGSASVKGTASLGVEVNHGKVWKNNTETTDETNFNQKNSETASIHTNSSEATKSRTLFDETNGKSTENSVAYSASASEVNKNSDSILTSNDKGYTNETVFSDSSESGSEQKTSSNTGDSNTNSTEISFSKEFAVSNQTTEQMIIETEKEVSSETSKSIKTTIDVNPGECKSVVCVLPVESRVIAFKCFRQNEAKYDIIPIDFMHFDHNRNSTNSQKCSKQTLRCQDRDKFQKESSKKSTSTNSIVYGQTKIPQEAIIKSLDGHLTLKLTKTGNLMLMLHDTLIWQNNIPYFDSRYEIQVRINEKGHFIQEVKGLFSETVNKTGYRSNEWITVWSSVPINYNYYMVGINASGSFRTGYELVLENSGSLFLYDAVGVPIWCTHQDCQHRNGYIFPEVYLVPTNMQTLEIKSDPHNSIPSRLRTSNTRSLVSLDRDCSAHLQSGNSLISANKRYMLILEDSGNLVFKDTFRTMWESSSAYLEYAEGPYQLILSPNGHMMILDRNRFIVWKSMSYVTNVTKPFTLSVLDEGKFVITDIKKKDFWESWPMRNMSNGARLMSKFQYRYVQCHGPNPLRVYILFSNQSNNQILNNQSNNQILNNQMLSSRNNVFDLLVSNSTSDSSIVELRKGLIRQTVLFNNKKLGRVHLTLKVNGQLVLENNMNYEFLSIGDYKGVKKSELIKKPFKAIMSNDDGKIRVLDADNDTLWTYPNACVSKQNNNQIKRDYAVNSEKYIESIQKKSKHACFSQCSQSDYCMSATRAFDGTCYLYGEQEGFVAKNGSTYFLKKCI